MRGRVRVGTLRHLVDDAPRIGRAIDDRGRSLDDFEPLERCEIGFIIERADIQPVDRIARGKAAQLDDRSEEHTSELQSLMRISYAVFCLKKKKKTRSKSEKIR